MLLPKPNFIKSALTLFNSSNASKKRFLLGACSLSVLLSGCSLGDTEDSTAFCPVSSDGAVAFVKRPLLFAERNDGNVNVLEQDDLREPETFRPGARLFIKGSTLPSAQSVDITSSVFSDSSFLNDDGELLYDVKDLSLSWDASKLVFAMRAPEIEGADEEDQPKWNLWVYDFDTCSLDRVIDSNTTAEAGQDIAPVFLPDDRILFSSTRQQTAKAILLDEGKTQFSALDDARNTEAFNLHVIDPLDQDITQITFNQSHDLDPIVMPSGKIVFSRWDNANGSGNNGMNLYEVNPDGTQLNYLYGRHSHDSGDAGSTVQYAKPQVSPDSGVIVQLREFTSSTQGGVPTQVDIDYFIEADQDVDGNPGIGQTPLIADLNTSGEQTLGGTYGSVFPLYDGSGRMLVSWSICRVRQVLADDAPVGTVNNNPPEVCTESKLNDADYEAAPPLYGLWMLDGSTQLPIEVPEEGQQFVDAVLISETSRPSLIAQASLDAEQQALADSNLGMLHIRSVYDFDGIDVSGVGIDVLADPMQTTADERPIRFMRIEKAVSIPDDDVRDFQNSAFGGRVNYMREILGYVPVEPDGSVKVAVPANVAMAFSLLDENGRRVTGTPRHNNWLTVMPGESVECIGCHTGNSEVPHGRRDSGPEPANPGATSTGVPFPNTEPALFADFGETMAEVYARVVGLRALTPDIVFDDEWTDANLRTKFASFDYSYSDLQTTSPINQASCAAQWTSQCRITINYPEHIHPLWGLTRQILDMDGVTVLQDNTCTTCHNIVDEANATMVPAQQLDLSNGPSTDEADHFKSYRELLFNDNEQELVGGILQDVMVDSGEFELDPVTGELPVDDEGNPIFIPILEPVVVSPILRTGGANNNQAFFDLFATGGVHEDYLSQAELRLISEWLDIGPQYWNDPFNPGVPIN